MKKLSLIPLTFTMALSSYAFVPEFHSQTQGFHAEEKIVELNNMSVNNLPKSMVSPLSAMVKEALAKGQDGYVKIPQTYKGVEIFGSEVVFEIKDGVVLSMDGRISGIQLNSVEPKISETRALEIAHKFVNEKSTFDTKLVIYSTTESTKLAWSMKQSAFSERWQILIDAQDGSIIDSYNTLAHGRGHGHDGEEVEVTSELDTATNLYVLRDRGEFARETYDAKNGGYIFGPVIGGLPGDLVTSENDYFTDLASVDAHNFAGMYLKVLKEKFNRNSYDNKGAKIMSTVHFMKKFVNAFWNGTQMVYGDGDNVLASNLAGGYDVIAHEISHAVTEHTSDLIYRNESGALNEAFSDIMATYAESVSQPEKFDWLIGEDVWTPGVEGDALRYMNDPAKDGQSSDFYADRYKGSQDNGGVHLNSGIANLAFYMLSEGGTHPRKKSKVRVEGLGIDLAIKLFYDTFTKRLTKASTFKDTREAMIKEAGNYGSNVVNSVKNAWSAVGVE